MERTRKRKHLTEKGYPVKQNFFMRLWYTSTNTYSESIFINSAKLYKYTDLEKASICTGTVLTLKDSNTDVSAVVLCKGTFEQMEGLESLLEDLADDNCETDDVITKVSQKLKDTVSDKPVRQTNYSDDTDIEEVPEIRMEQRKCFALKRSTEHVRKTSDRPEKTEGVSRTCRPAYNSKENEKKTSKDATPTSHLILAELRVQSTILKSLVEEFRILNSSLKYLREVDVAIPKNNMTFDGYDGAFSLASIKSPNPNVFARNFLRKRFTKQQLSTMILCPRGKTTKTEFSEEEVEKLQTALSSWYGTEYSWKAVVMSVNQFLRETKGGKDDSCYEMTEWWMSFSQEFINTLGNNFTDLSDDSSFLGSRTSISSRASSASSVSRIDSNGTFYDYEESGLIPSHDISGDVESSDDNEEDGHVTKYPMSLVSRVNSTLVTYVALTVLIIEKNISAVAFDSLLSVLQLTGTVQNKFTWRKIKRKIENSLYSDDCISPFTLEANSVRELSVFDILTQIRLILIQYYEVILSYRNELKKFDNGDVLCSDDDIYSTEPLILHLHVSTDGGQLFRFKKQSLWPFHAVLLDLPYHIRSRKENVITFCLWLSCSKPDWNSFLKEYLDNSIIGKNIRVSIGSENISIKVVMHTAVFDLPALASVMNHTQYNGKFGCFYCRSPGVSQRVGKGYSRKYGAVCKELTDSSYQEMALLADIYNQSIFGIKGRSCLSDFLEIPSHVLLDSLHLLFENCTKSLLVKLTDSSSFRQPFYLGRHLAYYEEVFNNVLVPDFIEPPKSFSEISFWKARDLMHFLFFYSFPTVFVSLFYKTFEDDEYAFHFFAFMIATRYSYSTVARSCHGLVKELFSYFHSRLSFLYDTNMCSMNMHLLLHVSNQIKRYGALPFASMFTFEHQFSVFKTFSHGTSSFLKQLSDKLTLLKHCKCFLNTETYDKKDKIVQQVLSTLVEDGFKEENFIDEGCVSIGKTRFYSRAYARVKNRSSVYRIVTTKGCIFADVLEFQLCDGVIIAKVVLLNVCIIPLLNILNMNLVNVPPHVIDIVSNQSYYYFVRNSDEISTIRCTKLLYPCVVFKNVHPRIDHLIYLVMPCDFVRENN